MEKWILVAALLILSAVLLSSRGAWLIAGYNTASSEKKETYHQKKLCRAVGVMLLIITTATTALFLTPGERFAIPYVIVLIATIVLTMIFVELKCKRK